MSYRPNYQGGRRGGGGRGRGGRGGGGRGGAGGRGEQRWWDPQWRAERLRQMASEVEKLDENEWWNKLKQLKEGGQQELIVKRNFGRDGQNVLADMARRQGLHFHAYNKGKTLVFSKVPLPDYRADLDERHGSTQKEIKMSTETERRVENLLARSKETLTINDSTSTSIQMARQSVPNMGVSKPESTEDDNAFKEKFNIELRDLQNSRKVTPSARVMQSFREKLPAFKVKDEFLKAIADNQGLTYPVAEVFLEDVVEKTRYRIKSEFDNFQGNSRRRRRRQPSTKNDPLTEMFEDVDIDAQYKNYSISTRQSLEAWDGTQLDLGLVSMGMLIPYTCTDTWKIVLATNIAESSITIDDVVYVIDCGKAKETSYDALNKLACLLPSWISKASAHQRRGRAGRVQPGVCYRLYPKAIHDAMPQYQLPEILRTPLQELCLNIKSLQLGEVATFLAKALQPPDPLSVKNALELLKTIGALDEMEELTPLGRHLCTLPLDPNIGKMLLIGSVFQCLDPALTIAAALAHRDPFVLPINRKDEADAAKRSFAGDSCSDHIALLKAFEAWKDAKRSGSERAFCWENFLSPMTLQMMEDMRNQFLDLLSDIGFVNKARGVKAYSQYGDDLEMVCAILCAGLYPNVIQCKRRGKRTAFYSKEVGKVDMHPSSVNAGVHLFPLPYMVYSEKVKTTGIYIRDSTNISDYALLLFGGSFVPSKTGEGIEMLGGYLHFAAPKSIIQLIQRLRGELDKLLQRKIEEPDLRPAVHVEIMVNIYKSMNSAVGAILTQRGEQVAISDTKMLSGGSPGFGDRNEEEKSEEEPIHDRVGEGSKYMQSHAPVFGNFRTGNPRCIGEKNEPAMNVSKKDVQSSGVEAFLKEKEPYSPQSSGDQKDSDYDSNDLGNEPRNGNDSCKRASKIGTSQMGEDYIRESKRQKLHDAVDVQDITGDVHAKEFSVFNSESVHEHQRCPNIKSSHATVHEATNGLFSCAFCNSSRTTEASGPMLHYIDGKPVLDDQALQLDVLHVHQKCIEWAPQVFFVGETAVNLEAELARASKIKCSSCGLKGAALGCYVKSCRRSFHVPCAAEIQDCRWDAENFLLLCPVHFSHKLPCERSKSIKKTKANRSLCYSSSPGDLTSPTKQQSDKLWTASSGATQEWLLCGSSLSNMEKDVLNDFVSLTGASVTNTWKANVTHVIAATDEHGACSRTLKVLMAILGGKWVLNVEWLRACMKAGHPVPEEPHEISHDIHGAFDGPRNGRIRAMQKAPKLFTGLTFYFSGHFMPYYKNHLEDLVSAAAGTVLEKSEITPTTLIVYSTEPLQGSNSDDLHEDIRRGYRDIADIVEPPKEGFVLTLRLDFAKLPQSREDRIKAISKISSLQAVILSSQLKDMLWNLGSQDMAYGMSKPIKLVYHPREPFFVIRMCTRGFIQRKMRRRLESLAEVMQNARIRGGGDDKKLQSE
ncbi:putative protein BREAST CANCER SUSCEPTIBILITY 1 [Cocos nucifera]|nr:putative protein BREAST CANCER SUSCEPTIBILITY 1 [Cocos nucifera]